MQLFKRKPSIKVTLRDDVGNISVTRTNATAEQLFILTFGMVQEIGKDLGMDTRQVMNRLVDLHKELTRNRKREIKKVRYPKSN